MQNVMLDIRVQERKIAEQVVPAHMLFLMLEQCQRSGYEVRSDVLHHLNLAVAAPLAKLDELAVSRVAKRADDIARSLLHDLSPSDPEHGLYVCAMLIMRLIDEGKWDDPKNQAVLVAMLLLDDVKSDKLSKKDSGPIWRVEEKRWHTEAGNLLVRAMLQGLYV